MVQRSPELESMVPWFGDIYFPLELLSYYNRERVNKYYLAYNYK